MIGCVPVCAEIRPQVVEFDHANSRSESQGTLAHLQNTTLSDCITNLREEVQGFVYKLRTDREGEGSYGDNAIVGAHQGDGAGAPC